MSDRFDGMDRLRDVLEALERIPYRFQSIHEPNDFFAGDAGREHLDSICMILVAVGEALRQLDKKTKGEWRATYPEIPWDEIIGLRNVIAHGYLDIDHEQIFSICKQDIPHVIETLRAIINDMEKDSTS